MAKPLSPDSRDYLIIGYDADGTHLYHLRANDISKERIRTRFEILAEHAGWSPFTKIDVFYLSPDEEFESIVQLPPVK